MTLSALVENPAAPSRQDLVEAAMNAGKNISDADENIWWVVKDDGSELGYSLYLDSDFTAGLASLVVWGRSSGEIGYKFAQSGNTVTTLYPPKVLEDLWAPVAKSGIGVLSMKTQPSASSSSHAASATPQLDNKTTSRTSTLHQEKPDAGYLTDRMEKHALAAGVVKLEDGTFRFWVITPPPGAIAYNGYIYMVGGDPTNQSTWDYIIAVSPDSQSRGRGGKIWDFVDNDWVFLENTLEDWEISLWDVAEEVGLPNYTKYARPTDLYRLV